MRVPFLFCPWFDSSWYLIAAAINYMFFYRASAPAWSEILRRNIGETMRNRWFSISSGIAYAESVILALGVGGILDHDPSLWKIFFFGSALIGMGGLAVLSRVEVEGVDEEQPEIGFVEQIKKPWRDFVDLMKERPDFSLFQWGMMLWGLGLMILQPALPIFAVDWLGISYMEIAAAVSAARGIGFALSSPLWGRWMERKPILHTSAVIFSVMGLFPLFLSLASFQIVWLYVAFFWYGIGQAGGHLIWYLSGPLFAGKEESQRYTGANVVMAGVRGMVGPSLGSFLSVFWGPLQVLGIGGLLCFCSGAFIWSKRKKSLYSN